MRVAGPLTLLCVWRACAVAKQQPWSPKVDVWSLGCLVLEMVTGERPWLEFQDQMALLFHVAARDVTPSVPEHVSPACRDFLSRCFVRDPAARASAEELLAHPWLHTLQQ